MRSGDLSTITWSVSPFSIYKILLNLWQPSLGCLLVEVKMDKTSIYAHVGVPELLPSDILTVRSVVTPFSRLMKGTSWSITYWAELTSTIFPTWFYSGELRSNRNIDSQGQSHCPKMPLWWSKEVRPVPYTLQTWKPGCLLRLCDTFGVGLLFFWLDIHPSRLLASNAAVQAVCVRGHTRSSNFFLISGAQSHSSNTRHLIASASSSPGPQYSVKVWINEKASTFGLYVWKIRFTSILG